MRFQHYDLGLCEAGETIEVTLIGGAAKVRLMDPANFHHYRWGEWHEFYGGVVTRSPWTIRIPSSGHWHLTVDVGTHFASIHSGIRRIPVPPSDSTTAEPEASQTQSHSQGDSTE